MKHRTISDTLVAGIRTVVPLGVAWLLTQLALLGVTLPADIETQLATGLTAIVAALYWAVVTWASKKWPAVGWLLGVAASPTYTKPAEPAPVTDEDHGV